MIGLRVSLCVFFVAALSYTYLDLHNKVMSVAMLIPQERKAIEAVKDENQRLNYQLAMRYSPQHLLDLLQDPAFSHLEFPSNSETHFIE